MGASSNILLSLIHEIGLATQFLTISLIANFKKLPFISGTFIKLQITTTKRNTAPQVQLMQYVSSKGSKLPSTLEFIDYPLTMVVQRFLFVRTITNKLSRVQHRFFATKNFRE